MGDQREKLKKRWIVLADVLDFSLCLPPETKEIKVVQMSSNFERVQKVINQAYAENFTWNPETCQDDLVLLIILKTQLNVYCTN